jgi:ABC-2 type transport system ATP-binding protein
MLEIKNVTKNYSTQCAVDNISFSLDEGKIFGLLGPNGAGKSSLLRMITGITQPDSGSIKVNGADFILDKHSQLIGYMPEERGLYKKMKIGEHALYLGQLKGLSRSEASAAGNYWFKKLNMETWANKKVEDLSKGMSQKLQFVITVMHNPKLLILDEPFSGLDPVNAEIIKQEIFALAKQGSTIIFSTHRMEQVEEICDKIVLINKGKNILEGNVAQIKQDFKTNTFSLISNNTISENKYFSIENKTENKTENNYTIKLAEGVLPNDALLYCINNNIAIAGFQEKLPSLNEIFIQLVNDQPSRQFLN